MIGTSKTWDTYGTAFFGTELFAFVSNHGNPTVIIGAPQVTLTDGDFSALAGQSFSGIATTYATLTNQVRKNIALYPTDGTGKTFTIRESSNLDDPFSYSTYGTLACTTKNSPANGFCSGTLSLNGVGGSGKVVCQVSTPGTQTMLACAAQSPQHTDALMGIIAVTPPRSVLAAVPSGVATTATANPATPPEITVTVKNMTGRKVTTMGQAGVAGERPQAPFAYKGTNYPGTGGTCSSTLDAYSTCTVVLTYSPSSLSSSIQTFRQEYDNGVGTVQGTSDVRGAAGLSSITITPSFSNFYTGNTQQFTAVATYSNATTQDVTSVVVWSSSNTGTAAMASSGLATFSIAGTANISATLGGQTSNIVSTTVTQGPTVVDTSTSSTSVANQGARRVHYDSVNDRHWAFYNNGTAIEYSYSSNDGATWTSAGTLAYNTNNFDVAFKDISGTGYFYVVVESGYDVLLVRGTGGASAITFDSAITVFDGSRTDLRYLTPAVAVSSDNYVWTLSRQYSGNVSAFPYATVCKRTTNVGSGTLSSFQTAENCGAATDSTALQSKLVGRADGKMIAVVGDSRGVNAYLRVSSTLQWPSIGGNMTNPVGVPGLGSNVLMKAITISGSNIIVGGNFSKFAGVTGCNGICRFNGTTWNAYGNGTTGTVNKIHVSGSNLFIGGNFADVGGNASADNIARWDGSTWYALGSGITPNANTEVDDIFTQGTNLFVGGNFVDAGGNTSCDYVARWDGSAWAAMGSGVNARVRAITRDGTNIFLGGEFTDAGTNASADRIARWMDGTINIDRLARWNVSGSTWNTVINANILATASITYGSMRMVGGKLYAGAVVGALLKDEFTRFNGTTEESLCASCTNKSVDDSVNAFEVVGNDIYGVGTFERAGDIWGVFYLFRYNTADDEFYPFFSMGGGDKAMAGALQPGGSGKWFAGDIHGGGSWGSYYVLVGGRAMVVPLSSTFNGNFYALTATSTMLYFAGTFTNGGSNANADYIAQYDFITGDDASLTSIGNVAFNDVVYALHHDGTNLFAGGNFTNVGGNLSSDAIAKWNGTTWTALGTGLGAGTVKAITNNGANVYAGGNFADGGGNTQADRLAMWNGSAWVSLGTGFSSYGGSEEVLALAYYSGNLYVGGNFQNLGGNASIDYAGRYDGSNWYPLGTLNGIVRTVEVEGSNILVGGDFTDAGGNATADYMARYTGGSLQAHELHPNGAVYDIEYEPTNYSTQTAIAGAFSGLDDGESSASTAAISKVLSYNATAALKQSSVWLDSSNNLHAIGIDSSGYVQYAKRTDSNATWSSNNALSSTSSKNPCLSGDYTNGNLKAFWQETNNIKYNRYVSSAWDSSATTAINSGTNADLGCDQNYTSAGNSLILWSTGSGSPYSVMNLRP